MNRGSSDNRDRSEVESSASSYSPHLAWTKLDNFAVFKLGRIHSLPALALLLLITLCMIADRRTGFVKSTVHALHEDSRIGRGTVPKMLAALESAGIVKIVRPFGPNVEGELEIVAWSDIVIETPREKTLRLTNLEKRQTAAQPRTGPRMTRENDQIAVMREVRRTGIPGRRKDWLGRTGILVRRKCCLGRTGILVRKTGHLSGLSCLVSTSRSWTRKPCRSRQTLAVPIAAAGWSLRCRRARTGACVTRTPGGSNGDRSPLLTIRSLCRT
jgi:hypothetical protein